MIDVENHERVVLLTHPLFSECFNVAMKEVKDPMMVFGIFMGFIAKEFGRYNYSEEDWKEFLNEISKAGWPTKNENQTIKQKPKLTIVK